MKLIINKNQIQSPPIFLRHIGYNVHIDRQTSRESFTRRLARDFYPRFHLYVGEKENDYIFSLHLDQKRPGYGRFHRHNAEYDGEVIEKEIDRIKGFLIKKGVNNSSCQPPKTFKP